ncbi:MAG: UbiH/UbiF/VisC/COQ6 family ubiquinone biosynthesis hydroxylase [Legionellales bacterium]|nr:UbiH/UbiF/VisC/COQ6 family ubiquinone biosynthesis hydroxylase [Legionellales bacterium]
MKQHDILIIGDGIVGLALAHALAKEDIDIAILSNSDLFARPKKQVLHSKRLDSGRETSAKNIQEYDQRVSAITLASEHLFKQLGVWEDISFRRVSPFRDMQVWDATGSGQIHFDSAWIGQTHLGHIIENSVMLAALQENLLSYSNVTYYPLRELTELMRPAEGVIVKTQQETIFTKLLIGADGANSWVRQQAGFMLKQQSYDQTAIIATVQTEHDHKETAWQRFMPTGPLAFLPLNHANQSSIVWSCEPMLAAEIMAYDDETFCQELGKALDFKLGQVLSSSVRQSFPLVMRHAERYIMENIALVGDAAHTIHPLAGQGLNLGLADVACLVKALQKNLSLNRPLGYMSFLRQYERERRIHNLLMIKAMNMFKHLFSNEHALLVSLRNNGLNGVDSLSWLKIFFMQQAAGIGA